ncbi:MAG: SDR family oxidoreductase [Acidimicrobiaceae bacterium]|nr:SDR family oxidoreductase [Acidimicrobiaceae bacterium]
MDYRDVMDAARDVEHTRLDPSDILVTDQVAVVTGGGSGIGLGVALGLARFGADVAVLDVDASRCAAAEEALAGYARRSAAIVCDVTEGEALREAIADIADRWGRMDILVNNAGGVRGGPFLTQPDRSIRRHIDLNLTSMLVATHEATQRMIDGGRGGAIVNVSSIEGSRAAPLYAVYAACKAAMINFTQTMALELAEHGIRVNCISPDHTITPGMRGNRAGPVDPSSWADSSPEYAKVIPLGREGVVDECAATVIWLCSKMSAYVTGANIPVDGGTSAAAGWQRTASGEWTWGL